MAKLQPEKVCLRFYVHAHTGWGAAIRCVCVSGARKVARSAASLPLMNKLAYASDELPGNKSQLS